MTINKLHRIYFGFDGKPDMFSSYLRTWERQLPGFEIVHWNANNLPMDVNDYTRQLYAERDHAFLTDYFRWWVLREHGGVYLDADIEVVNGAKFAKLIDELEAATEFDAFIGIDERTGGWYTAHSMASKSGGQMASFMCEVYEGLGHLRIWRKKALYLWAPQMAAVYFANRGHHVDGMGTTPRLDAPTIIANVKIYPQDYFSPLAPTGRRDKPFILNAFSENTSLCHHFACTWHAAESIYSEHARTKGGSAGLLLQDIADSAAASVGFQDKLRESIPTPWKHTIKRLLSVAD